MPSSHTYPFTVNGSGRIYTFHSVGRRTLIKKVIFTAMRDGYFNVELRTEINGLLLPDTEVSNNGDAHAVLATVSLIVAHFLTAHPAIIVHIKGSDERRQRIYQQLLVEAEKEKPELKIFGLRQNGILEPLNTAMLYDACFVINL